MATPDVFYDSESVHMIQLHSGRMAHTELKRDGALSGYVVFRLRTALQTIAAKDLARQAGVSGAAISHVKTGKTGVGPRMARGLARVWGFGTVATRCGRMSATLNQKKYTAH